MDLKQVEKIKTKLKKKFQRAEELDILAQNQTNADLQRVIAGEQTEEGSAMQKVGQPIVTFDDASKSQKTKAELKKKFKQDVLNEKSKIDFQKKMFKPITDALEKVETVVKKVDEDIKGTTALKALEFPSAVEVPTLKSLKDNESQTESIINLGPLAKKYLPRAKGTAFEFSYDPVKQTYTFGKYIASFNFDDIILNGEKYSGTPGLWRLLTSSNYVEPELYTKEDLSTYTNLLYDSEAIYQNNEKSTNRPKSSKSTKWNNLISKIWTQKSGSGLLEYNENPVEYKYVDGLNELMKRLYFLYAEEQAGNNNFHNEKLGILHFFTNCYEKVIDSPKGMEYLIRLGTNLPKGVLREGQMKQGSGIFNALLNKLDTEIHVPGFNYLGPGTKLEERLARGDKPINKLDEAAMEHDIFYNKHKGVKERHKADEVLEYKAWDRVFAPDASLKERTAAYLTTNAMKIKRHLGFGLKF